MTPSNGALAATSQDFLRSPLVKIGYHDRGLYRDPLPHSPNSMGPRKKDDPYMNMSHPLAFVHEHRNMGMDFSTLPSPVHSLSRIPNT